MEAGAKVTRWISPGRKWISLRCSQNRSFGNLRASYLLMICVPPGRIVEVAERLCAISCP